MEWIRNEEERLKYMPEHWTARSNCATDLAKELEKIQADFTQFEERAGAKVKRALKLMGRKEFVEKKGPKEIDWGCEMAKKGWFGIVNKGDKMVLAEDVSI